MRHAVTPLPEEQRRFAADVVRRLRGAGFVAYWAGGCVRDQLLGRTPKDYDVATSATPEQIRTLFGRRRTLAIGAAFGVISVIGPKPAGMIEVATFRRDAAYSDGRHPDSVTFSSAEEDASRRDFTINGLFYDPVEGRVIDFVGGQRDLAERRVRAIGRASDRFAEDKLRMLRAVRFAAAFDFALDDDARAAIAEMAPQIHAVSPERIAMEMQRTVGRFDPRRRRSLAAGDASGGGGAAGDRSPRRRRAGTARRYARAAGSAAGRRRVSAGAGRGAFVVRRRGRGQKGLPAVAVVEQGDGSRRLARAKSRGDRRCARRCPGRSSNRCWWPRGSATCWRWWRPPRRVPRRRWRTAGGCWHSRPTVLDPPPLLTGDDLLANGIPSGPQYRMLLERIRTAQLDGEVRTKPEALAMVRKWVVESG